MGATSSSSRIPVAERPSFEHVLVTPSIARSYLNLLIPRMRPARPTRISAFARDMVNGAWRENTAETIKFDVRGRLIDGQHRLGAVLKAQELAKEYGVPFIGVECIVARNVPEDAFHALDGVTPRDAGDVLYMAGVDRAKRIVPVLRWIILHNRVVSGKTRLVKDPHLTPTKAELEITLERHPEVAKSVEVALALRSSHTLPEGPGAFLHYKGSRTSPEKAEAFIHELATGETDPQPHNPILILRRKIADHRAPAGRRIDVPYLTALAILAWRAFEDGERLPGNRLSWQRDKAWPEFRCDEVDAKTKAE